MKISKNVRIKIFFIYCVFAALLNLPLAHAVTIGALNHINDLAESGGVLYVTPQGTYYTPSIGGYSYSYTTPYNRYDDGVYYDTGPVSGYYYSPPVGYGLYKPHRGYSSSYYRGQNRFGYGGGWRQDGKYHSGKYYSGEYRSGSGKYYPGVRKNRSINLPKGGKDRSVNLPKGGKDR